MSDEPNKDVIYDRLTEEQKRQYDIYMTMFGNVYLNWSSEDGFEVISPLDVEVKEHDSCVQTENEIPIHLREVL